LSRFDLFAPRRGDGSKALPFSVLGVLSRHIFLGKVPEGDLAAGLAIEAAWVLGLMILSRILSNGAEACTVRRGLKKLLAPDGIKQITVF